MSKSGQELERRLDLAKYDLYCALIHLVGISASLKPNDNVSQEDIDDVLIESKKVLSQVANYRETL